jgi:hypothetical protein
VPTGLRAHPPPGPSPLGRRRAPCRDNYGRYRLDGDPRTPTQFAHRRHRATRARHRRLDLERHNLEPMLRDAVY